MRQGRNWAWGILMVVWGSAAVAESHLNRPSALDTLGMMNSELYQRIYRGDFDNLHSRNLSTQGETFQYLFVHSATAFAEVCPQSIAPDSPTFEISSTTTNGWGNSTGSRSRKYRVDTRFAEKTKQYGITFGRNIAGLEVLELFRRNGCTSAATKTYLENLLRFAYERPPVQQDARSK